tara:strand:+ start:1491 stop:2867 length:1377 start_codon:yes stop_codon:yes gene_type:complete
MVLQTECGLFASISKTDEPISFIIENLKKLNHRGRDCYGISYLDEEKNLSFIKKDGDVDINNFSPDELSVKAKGFISHLRYATSGNKDKIQDYTQPFHSSNKLGSYSLAHNGNIPNSIWDKFKDITFPENIIDTQKLIYYINYLAKYNNIDSWIDISKILLEEIECAYCLLILTEDKLYVIRDRYGLRPLSLFQSDDKVVIASETIAIPDGEKGIIRDVNNGEILEITYKIKVNSITSYYKTSNNCLFEYIYFLRDNSIQDGIKVSDFRYELGKKLVTQLQLTHSDIISNWQEENAIVSGVPSSGNIYGESIASTLKLEYSQFLKKRSNYPWRTFILENDDKRIQACQKKYILEEDEIKGKTVILADDSIVRGNTLKYLVKYLKKSQPKKIFICVASPMIVSPCNYGVDFPDIEELIMTKTTPEQLAKDLEIDGLFFLSVDNLQEYKSNKCMSCFFKN